jgi:hypothetical protein
MSANFEFLKFPKQTAISTSLRSVALGSLLFGAVLSGCTTQSEEIAPPAPQMVGVAFTSTPRAPEGVMRYCWEEPIVEFEKNGPGIDAENKWYHPAYVAVREVRSGKWRPCKPAEPEK